MTMTRHDFPKWKKQSNSVIRNTKFTRFKSNDHGMCETCQLIAPPKHIMTIIHILFTATSNEFHKWISTASGTFATIFPRKARSILSPSLLLSTFPRESNIFSPYNDGTIGAIGFKEPGGYCITNHELLLSCCSSKIIATAPKRSHERQVRKP